MSDGKFTRIRDHEIGERWRSIAYFAALAVASVIAVAAFVVAIVTVARQIG